MALLEVEELGAAWMHEDEIPLGAENSSWNCTRRVFLDLSKVLKFGQKAFSLAVVDDFAFSAFWAWSCQLSNENERLHWARSAHLWDGLDVGRE